MDGGFRRDRQGRLSSPAVMRRDEVRAVDVANRLSGQERGLQGAALTAPCSVEAQEPHGTLRVYRPKRTLNLLKTP